MVRLRRRNGFGIGFKRFGCFDAAAAETVYSRLPGAAIGLQ